MSNKKRRQLARKMQGRRCRSRSGIMSRRGPGRTAHGRRG